MAANDLHKTNVMNCHVSTSKWPGLYVVCMAFSDYWWLKFSVMNTYLGTYTCERFKLTVKLKLRGFL